jgi:hypothetical protein
MPDISYQMQLMNAAQNRPMQDIDTLMNSIGRTWQNREARTDEQDAVKFFTENSASPETIQSFSAQHPQMPLTEVYKYAGTIATQKRAKLMTDAGVSFMDFLKNTDTKSMSMEKVQEFMKSKNMTPEQEQEFLKHAPKAIEFAKADIDLDKTRNPEFNLGADEIRYKNISGKSVEIARGKGKAEIPDTWVVLKNGTQKLVTKSEAAQLSSTGEATKYEKPPEPKEAKTPQIRSVDRGDVVDIYENGVKVRTEPKGVSPGMAPKTPVDKGATSVDLGRLGTMIQKATERDGGPTDSEITVISTLADRAGYEFKKETVKGELRGIPGIKLFDFRTDDTTKWVLVPKTAGTPSGKAHVLVGQKSGQYKVNGKLVKWDGTQELP